MKLPLGRIALTVSVLLPAYFMVAALGVKFGLWPWQVGLGVMIVAAGLPILGIALILALVALILSLVRKPKGAWLSALMALLIPVAGLGFLAQVRSKAEAIPPIHDITTDIVDTPTFSGVVMAARKAAGANPVITMDTRLGILPAYQGERFKTLAARTLGEVGHTAYPEVRPVVISAPPATAFPAALAEAEAQGWTITAKDPAAGVIEATAETFWFGFKDDIAVRVRPRQGASIIDLRSTSRVGQSDLGTNAARIETYLAGLAKRFPNP